MVSLRKSQNGCGIHQNRSFVALGVLFKDIPCFEQGGIKLVSARTFTEVVPYYQYERTEGGWRDGMVTGNGHTGVICSSAPYSETLIYQNIEFIMPSRDPRKTPEEVTSQLHEARQAVVNSDDMWNVHDRKRTFLYCFHPA